MPSDVEVRRRMEMAFSELHYPLFGQPAAFAQPWKGQVVVGAGYTLGWSDYDRVNVVAIFSSLLGHSRLAAVTNFVPHTDLHYAFPEEPEGEPLRFFIYGFRLGKSQPRLTAIFYSFDGQNLKSLWEAHDVYDGKIEVEKDRSGDPIPTRRRIRSRTGSRAKTSTLPNRVRNHVRRLASPKRARNSLLTQPLWVVGRPVKLIGGLKGLELAPCRKGRSLR